LCDGGKDNVVVLDWGKHSHDPDYKNVVFKNAQKVGGQFAKSIKTLKEAGLNLNRVRILGFSVGSHIASFAGRCNNFKIPHITVLDPASPAHTECKGCYISSKCARRVEMIHTDMTKYGANFNQLTASVHYVANNGKRDQCDCPASEGSKQLSPE
ncbi:PREDICTED: lipase member H-like, partial [Wasmannia auropunctata]|uniref:lipase member H-like n=1 Tax=Wasmannia auropunctata TaxID=64793 RepID=UPI0005EDA709